MTLGRRGGVRRILMSADTIGGVWTYAVDLAAEWTRAGVEVVLATLGNPLSAAQRRALAEIERVRLEESRFRLEWMEGAEADVAASGDWLVDLARRCQPDVVHINGFAHAALSFAAPVVAVAHSDVVSWRRAVLGTRAPDGWAGYATRTRRGLDAADLVIAPTRAVLDDLATSYGWHGGRARVIHNGIALDPLRSAEKQPVILGAGRLWDAAKNLLALDRAAAGLRWPVEIAGDPKHPHGGTVVLQHARPLGALGRASLLDRMAEAAIFAAPARYEPFGLGILEAAAVGAALVLGDIPSLRELWGDAAIFVDPADDAGLAAALARLIDDPVERKALAQRSRVRALGFSRRRMAQRYLEAFAALRRPALVEA